MMCTLTALLFQIDCALLSALVVRWCQLTANKSCINSPTTSTFNDREPHVLPINVWVNISMKKFEKVFALSSSCNVLSIITLLSCMDWGTLRVCLSYCCSRGSVISFSVLRAWTHGVNEFIKSYIRVRTHLHPHTRMCNAQHTQKCTNVNILSQWLLNPRLWLT